MNKFLSSDKVFYATPWIYAITTLAYEIVYMIFCNETSIFDLGLEILNVLIVFGITASYKAHEKNIMKTLFGALIMGGIIYYFFSFSSCLGKADEIPETVFSAVLTLLSVVLFINHLILGYGHKSNPSRTSLNRVVGLLIVLCMIIGWVRVFVSVKGIIIGILAIVSEAAVITEILCVETKVDAYKIIRESK